MWNSRLWLARLTDVWAIYLGTMCTQTLVQPMTLLRSGKNDLLYGRTKSSECGSWKLPIISAMVISTHSKVHWVIDSRACPHGTQLYLLRYRWIERIMTYIENDLLVSSSHISISYIASHPLHWYSRYPYFVSYMLYHHHQPHNQ